MAFFSSRGEAIAGCRFSFQRKRSHADMKPAFLTSVFSVHFQVTLFIASDLCWLEDLESAFMKNTVFLSLVIKVESRYWCLPEFILNTQADSESPTSIKLLRRREPGSDSLQAFVRCEESGAGRGVSIKGANNSVHVCVLKQTASDLISYGTFVVVSIYILFLLQHLSGPKKTIHSNSAQWGKEI